MKRKLPPRSEQVKTLQSGEEYDVIIIGGGATGAGCALDAITRGKFWCFRFQDIWFLLLKCLQFFKINFQD